MTNYIGTATSRIDGRAKVTGAAKYAAEFNVPGLVHGYVVQAVVAKGRIARIDTSAALAVAGVLDVLTHLHRPRMADNDIAYHDDVAAGGSPYRPLYDDRILYDRQPVALVLAERSEIARFAASLVRIEYRKEGHATELWRNLDAAETLSADTFAMMHAEPRGDADRAFAAASARHRAEYRIAPEHHNPMEMYGTTAVWQGGGKITVYDKTQGVLNVHGYLCRIFDMKPEDLRVMSPYMGGGFGSGLRPQYNCVLAVLGARALQRSVRVALTRQQMYSLGYRPDSVERVALAARADGTLEALTHDAIAITSRYETFARRDGPWGGVLYACPNTRFSHKLSRLDVATPCDMRAPGAASGVYALECAMDELAATLNIDPVELRLRNYSERDQNEDAPFTSKQLRECYRQGAAAFGWDKRGAAPRSMRDDKELIGWGMATGIWEALDHAISVRLALTANGHGEVSCATSDIGTGTYTVMAQVTAEMLGLPIENVRVTLGDSTLPQSPVEGGSWIASSVSNAIAIAGAAIRAELLGMAQRAPGSPLAGAKPEDVALRDGKLASAQDANRAVPIAEAMRLGGVDRIVQETTFEPARNGKHARNTHSAVFAEVKVDEQLGVVRVTRIVSAVAAGRILNPKTARSQVLGSIIMGIGMALHEETLVDHRLGRIMNANYAEYQVPVHADVYDIQVLFVEEPDTLINPLGTKGVGEIGIVGTAAAVVNAIYHATGKRLRDLPIRIEQLL